MPVLSDSQSCSPSRYSDQVELLKHKSDGAIALLKTRMMTSRSFGDTVQRHQFSWRPCAWASSLPQQLPFHPLGRLPGPYKNLLCKPFWDGKCVWFTIFLPTEECLLRRMLALPKVAHSKGSSHSLIFHTLSMLPCVPSQHPSLWKLGRRIDFALC